MEDFAPDGESQVWQRVFAQPEPKRENLRPLLLSAMEAAAAYRYLAGILPQSLQEPARELYTAERATIAALKGLSILSGSGRETEKSLPVPREQADKLLGKCFHRARRALAEYTARSVDPEFGVVFDTLAKREGAHCAELARLLGSLGK